MGIRYYASPVRAADVETVLADPDPFCGYSKLTELRGEFDERPDSLDLDKCWRELQVLLRPVDERPARAAYLLVEGQVTHEDYGWIPFECARSPAQVQAIAQDLASVGTTEIRKMLLAHPPWSSGPPEQEFEYVLHHLEEAKRFVKDLTRRGDGLVYFIG